MRLSAAAPFPPTDLLKVPTEGTSLAVQWLRLRASNAGGAGLIPGRGTKTLHAVGCSQERKKIEARTEVVSE